MAIKSDPEENEAKDGSNLELQTKHFNLQELTTMKHIQIYKMIIRVNNDYFN